MWTFLWSQVPAVLRRFLQGASASVHRQSVGLSCYATESGTHSANCAEGWRFHSAVLGEAVDTPVVFQRQVLGLFQPVLKTVEVPQLQCFQGGRCPCSCSSSTRCGRPCDYAGTCLAVGGATDSVHRLIWWTPRQISQLGAMMGFFDAFCVIFRAPPVVPELSASRSWRSLDDEEFFVIEGWGVALTPGVGLPGVRPSVVH